MRKLSVIQAHYVSFFRKLYFCFFITGATLNCYHCLERPKSTEKHLSCAYFDMSDKFHKECTHSSFCMKRTSQFQLHNGSMPIKLYDLLFYEMSLISLIDTFIRFSLFISIILICRLCDYSCSQVCRPVPQNNGSR